MPRPTTRPIVERIISALVERIRSGDLKTGDRIVESEIATDFGTSRGPVRDAFRFLQARRWIELQPNHGARVAWPRELPSTESVAVAAAMFGLACRFACTKATEQELTTLSEMIHVIAQRAGEGSLDPEDFLSLTQAAGFFIVSIAKNPQIDDVMGPVPMRASTPFGHMGLHTPEDLAEASTFWVRLGTAMLTGDADDAESIGGVLVRASFKRIVAARLRHGGS
jgi:DNA-binding GntR family transcriptional regulator